MVWINQQWRVSPDRGQISWKTPVSRSGYCYYKKPICLPIGGILCDFWVPLQTVAGDNGFHFFLFQTIVKLKKNEFTKNLPLAFFLNCVIEKLFKFKNWFWKIEHSDEIAARTGYSDLERGQLPPECPRSGTSVSCDFLHTGNYGPDRGINFIKFEGGNECLSAKSIFFWTDNVSFLFYKGYEIIFIF